MRFLYSKSSTTYDVLLSAIKEAEIEWMESRGQARMKSATIVERSDEIEELRKKLDQITAAMKLTSYKGPKQKKDKRDSPSGSGPSSPRVKKEDVWRNLRGPPISRLDPSNLIKATFNATNVADGGMDGESVQRRET